ncbi:hypothetical protein Q0F98_14995 [Paenibacillus amylolyticus]|nr:hypothetical protein Q0F98_14995 [Paenibacillus amylolyticus]
MTTWRRVQPLSGKERRNKKRLSKTCMYCGQQRPMSEFRRRTGKRAGPGARRGACRSCRQLGGQADHDAGSSVGGQTNERIGRQRDGLDTREVTARPSATARNESGRTSHVMEQGTAKVSESDRSLVSQPSVESSSLNDDEHADLVTFLTLFFGYSEEEEKTEEEQAFREHNGQ